MEQNDKFPVICDGKYLRHIISFEVGQLPKSMIQALGGKDREKRWAAQRRITERIAARFDSLQVRRSEAMPMHTVPVTHSFFDRD